MSTSQLIREKALIHAQLLASIAELNHVPSSLSLHTNYLEEIQVQHNESETRLKSLSEASKRKYRKLTKLRNSATKKLAYRLMGMKGKLIEKENKRKREHQEALEQELGERDSHNVVSQLLTDAKYVKFELEARARHLESLKQDLIYLYREIFDGPTPEFPEDDRLEYHLQTSQSLHDHLQRTWNAERQTEDILAAVGLRIVQCQDKMREAAKFYRMGLGTEGDSTTGRRHGRLAFSEAQSLAAQIETLCRQVQGISPLLHSIKEFNAALTSLLTTISTNVSPWGSGFLWRIEFELENLYRIDDQLREQRGAAQLRASVTYTQLSEVSQILDDSRRAIYNFRRSTFLRVVSEMENASSDHSRGIAHSTALPDQRS